MNGLKSIGELVRDAPVWLRWLTLAFCERHVLQSELRLLLKTQLPPDAPPKGQVPGREEWSYTRTFSSEVMLMANGRAMPLDLRSDLEVMGLLDMLTVLTPPQPGLTTDPDPSAVTQAVRRWLVGNVLHAAIGELVDVGLLVRDGTDRFRLQGRLADACDLLKWPLDASEGFEELVEQWPSYEEAEPEWTAWLLEVSSDPGSGALAQAHERLAPADVERLVHEFLREPLGPPTDVALSVAEARGIEVSDEVLAPLVAQIRPAHGEDRAAGIMRLAARALQRHPSLREATIERLVCYGEQAPDNVFEVPEDASEEATREIWQHVAGFSLGVPGLDEAARLLLEHAPTRSLPTVRRALRDEFGWAQVAIRLVAIGQPWAIRELEHAVPEMNNPSSRAVTLGLLKHFGHELAHLRAAKAAAESPPPGMFGIAEASGMLGDLESAMMPIYLAGVEGLSEWATKVRESLPLDM